MASVKQSEMPSGRKSKQKRICGDELWVCQVKKYTIDRSEDKTKKISQHKAKIQAKNIYVSVYICIFVCVWVCEKTETWRFNPDTQDLPEFVASENKEN